MSGKIAPFPERYRRALADPRLRTNLLNFQRAWRVTRDTVFSRLAEEAPEVDASVTSWTDARERLKDAKNEVLADPLAYQQRFVDNATAAGARVHFAATADDARRIVLEIARQRGARLVAKGKSMVAEEIFLNHYLEENGLRVVETDLGEWIIQLARETPSHMVMPAIHKSRQQVADLFESETHQPVPHEDIQAQVGVARRELRRVFLSADVGMIGANALIADTGTVVLVTNEGNGDLVSTLPDTLIVTAGRDKLVPSFDAVRAHLRLLARSGTGQEITTYTSFITGSEPGRELHIVLVDNGRTEMWQDPDFRDALRCIRCAACADVCPPYQVVGGHVFGYVYSGAIGLVNTPFHHGLDADAGPQSLCVQCNACATVCPVEIPLPRQILDVRAKVVEEQGLPPHLRAAYRIWESPRLFDLATRAAAAAQTPLKRDRFLRVPLPPAWSWRTPPALASKPARDAFLGRVFEPDPSTPWSESGAKGLTVAYFLQCLTDRFAPEQADAAVRLLRACGARVVVPSNQHCCGLPHLDAGDKRAARRMAKRTIEGLEEVPADYVVTAAASCAVAILHDYARILRDEPLWRQRAERLASRTLDLLTFLERVADPPQLDADPGGNAATYHSFCQSTNVLGIGSVGARMLKRAGVSLADLPEGEVCCGFGGSTSINHPAVAREIAARKLANVAQTGAPTLCTDNPGCVLHLRGAADAAGQPLDVRHVAEVLAARLNAIAPPGASL